MPFEVFLYRNWAFGFSLRHNSRERGGEAKMATGTVVVSSITYAMRGQQLLQNKGYKAYVDRDLTAFGKYGCGYCIRIQGPNVRQAVELLEENKIKIKEVLYQ